MPYDTITLQKLMLGSHMRLDGTFLHDARLESWREHAIESLVLNLRGYIWAEPPQEISVSYPRDWWEHFKLRWFPAWAQKKWPVEYETKIMEAQIFYPKLPQTVPEHVYNLRMAVLRESESNAYYG